MLILPTKTNTFYLYVNPINMKQGKEVIRLVDKALESKDKKALERMVKETPAYLMTWVEHANLEKIIINTKIEKIVLTFAYLADK